MLEDKNIDFEADLFIECEILHEAEEIEEETVVIVPDLDPHLNVYIPSEQEVGEEFLDSTFLSIVAAARLIDFETDIDDILFHPRCKILSSKVRLFGSIRSSRSHNLRFSSVRSQPVQSSQSSSFWIRSLLISLGSL